VVFRTIAPPGDQLDAPGRPWDGLRRHVADAFAREAAADIPARLEQSPAGRVFLAELTRHLARYGHRTADWGLSTPSFVEDPSPVLKVLKDYVTQPDGADPGRELERLAREREAAVAEARERLRGYPAPVVARFEEMLEAAQGGLVLTEDHGFYIDAYAVSLVRDVIAAIGRRLADAGVLDEREDVLMLTCDELREATLGARRIDARALVAVRRAALALHAGVTPPPVLGTMPGVAPAGRPAHAPAREVRRRARAVARPGRRPRGVGLGGDGDRRRARRGVARGCRGAAAGRRPRRRDDRAAVDAALRRRRRRGHRHRRDPQPLGRRGPRVRDPRRRRGGDGDERHRGRRRRRGRR
jgi:hypothetical protein